MGSRVQAAHQRKLDDRNIRLWVHQLQRNEQAMVKPSLAVNPRRQIIHFRHRNDPLCQFGVARSRVGNFIGLFGEAIIVIEHRRVFRPQQGGNRLFPVSADHEDGLRLFELNWQLFHKINHCLMTGIAKDRQRTAAMREIYDLCSTSRVCLFHH